MSVSIQNNGLSVKIIHSIEEFDSQSENWNDLWVRSTNTNPTARSETLSLFCKYKIKKFKFITFIIEDNIINKWVAALPLLEEVRLKAIRCAVTPRLISACLLVDQKYSPYDAVRLLIYEIRKTRNINWICAESVRLESFEWSLFLKILREDKISYLSSKTHDTAVIFLGGEVDQLRQSWCKNKLKEINKSLRKLSSLGIVELVEITLKKDMLELLPVCFEIENKSWKGGGVKGATSIIKRGQADFFIQNAALLADSKNLIIYGLTLNGKWIAFQYGFYAKKVIYSNKISYDLEFKKYSPGFILRHLAINYIVSNRNDMSFFDCCGEYGKFQSYWSPKLDPVGFIVFPVSNKFSEILFLLYKFLKKIFIFRDKFIKHVL